MPPWQGSVIAVRGWLRLLVKDEDGKWRQRALGLADTPENRTTAEKRLVEVRRAMLALERATGGEGGVLTLRRWLDRWLLTRKNKDAENDESRMRLHVLAYDEIADLPLAAVEPRHIHDLSRRWLGAPRTRRNIYTVIKAAFRDAEIEGLIPRGLNPCILTHRQLGKIKDSKGFKRREARFDRDELEALIGDERLPRDRRAWYALLGLGMLRTGEAAGLRWEKVQPAQPLGRIAVETSYDVGETKTVDRWVPAHPTLAAILAEWKLGGWAAMFGRAPEPGDLVCPVAPEAPRKGRRKEAGSMRDKNYARKRIVRDLATLGLRHRRAHDLRRTGISLAQDDGADKDVLRWATHAPPTEVFDGYTSLEWETLCREVAKMRVSRQPGPATGATGRGRGRTP
jgi:integrase